MLPGRQKYCTIITALTIQSLRIGGGSGASSSHMLLPVLNCRRFRLTEDAQEDEEVLTAILESLPQPAQSSSASPPPGPFSQEITMRCFILSWGDAYYSFTLWKDYGTAPRVKKVFS